MNNDIEQRTFVMDLGVEERADKPKKILGHAALFNTVAEVGPFQEQFAPGAFRESIESDDVRAFVNHDKNMILGRKSAGTLALREDDKGLMMEIDPPATGYAQDLITSIRRGDISQASIGFQALDDSWETVDGKEIRTVKRAKLFEVSPVSMPAYANTDVALRSMQSHKDQEEQKEERKRKEAKQNIQHKRMRLRVQQQS